MSLDLDTRQRAMLQEMGVRVWWPEPKVEPARQAVTAGRPMARIEKPMPSDPPAVPTPAAKTANLQTGATAIDAASLALAVSSCQACGLSAGRRAPVLNAAELAQRADILVLGEPPDESEERAGLAFAGPAGQLLDNMLRAIGVSRSGTASRGRTAYLTNVVKCRPAAMRNPEPQELATCESHLKRELALVQPRVILALGRFAAQTLLAGTAQLAAVPLGKLRGKVHSYQGLPVVVSYHPGYLLRTPLDKARAWADLCLVLELLKSETQATT